MSDAAPTPEHSPESLALAAAAHAAKGHGMTEPDFRASVTSIDHVTETYQRALHVIERRQVVLKQDPGLPTRTQKVEPLPDPERVDPWTVDVERLAKDSRVVAQCPGCHGAKSRTCPGCAGSTRRKCSPCGGSGRVPGAKRGSTKNCPTCRARGDVKCTACRSGRIDCVTCGADGQVEAWLEVERQQLTQVHASAANVSSTLHAQLSQPADFDAPPRAWVGRLVEDTGARDPSLECPKPLRAQLRPREDRLLSTRLQSFASDLFRVNYATAARAGKVEVAGSRLLIAPTSNWTPLAQRRRASWVLGGVFGLVGVLAYLAYVSRHEWFSRHGHGFLVLLPLLVAAPFAARAFSQRLLAPRARSAPAMKRSLGLVGAGVAMSIGAFVTGGPQLDQARQALAAGDKPRARMEANALVALGAERQDGEQLLDGMYLEDVRAAPSALQQAQIVRWSEWRRPEAREQALALLRGSAQAASDAGFKAHDGAALLELFRAVDGLLPEASLIRGRAALARAATCLNAANLVCVDDELSGGSAPQAPAAEREALRESYLVALRTAREQALAQATATPDREAQRLALTQALDWSQRLVKHGDKKDDASLTALAKRLSKVEEQLATAKRLAEEQAAREKEEAEAEAASYRAYSGGGRVQVRGYYRKNGTYVAPHSRRK